MGAFFVYIVKSAVCLAVFYLFYRLLLSRETFHRFNRIALLGILILSCAIPFVEVTMKEPMEVSQQLLTWEELLLMANLNRTATIETAPESAIMWREALLMVYLLGIVFFFLRNVWSLTRMLRLIKGSTLVRQENGITLITHQKEIAPFSWMKFVVISEKDLKENGEEILTHEYAHIRKRHSIDLLIADICIFFQWFNPASWLLKQELQNIHEFEADESVIAQGIDAKKYQLLLIKKAVGTRLYSMANSFNHSSLKKRITMMLKKKSNPWKLSKYLIVFPLAAITAVLFARPNLLNMNNQEGNAFIQDTLDVRHFEEILVSKSYAESDTVQIIEIDTLKMHIPVGYAGWSISESSSDDNVISYRKGVYQKEKGILRLSSTTPWTESDLADFVHRVKKGMLKSLNELYGVKKQQNAHPALAHEVKTSHTVKCIYYVKDFFKIYCTDGGGTGHDGQLILLDGKEISYQQLKSLSPDDLLHDVWEILPESTNLESKFGSKAKKGIWVLASKKNPSYLEEFEKKLAEN